MLTIACVLKNGGDYDSSYVRHLFKQCRRQIELPFNFVCFTDKENDFAWEGLQRVHLSYGLNGWWSKLEVFRLKGQPVLYLDLDTVLAGSLDPLIAQIEAEQHTFLALRPFKPTEVWASGVLGFNGDFSGILESVTALDIIRHRWDQRWMSHWLGTNSVDVSAVQDFVNVVSYKHHCRSTGKIPADASIVCFHGKPRPRDVGAPFFEEEALV
jgi:hypothetical protein